MRWTNRSASKMPMPSVISSLILAFALFASRADATPKFNTVNGNDLQGNACPLPTYNAYPCPVICVRNVDQCPQSVKPPTCPEGQTYCVDGQCHSGSCPSDLLSFCACFGAPDIQGEMYPCSQDQVVTIPNFNAANKTEQSLAACSANATITVGDWSANATGPVWNTCPTAYTPAGPPNYTSPFFMAMWIFFASLPVLNILWYLYKIAREKAIKASFDRVEDYRVEKYHDQANPDEKVPGSNPTNKEKQEDDTASYISSTEPQDKMVMKAYKRDPIGMVMFVIYGLQTAGIVAMLITMVYDYYPRGYIPAYLLFNGDALVQSSTFMGMWYVLFFWFASLTMFRSRIPNFYRIQCTYNEGHYIQVEKNEPSVVLLEDSNKLMDTVRQMETKAKKMFGMDVVVNTSKLMYTKAGTKYFEYQCTRYVFNPETQLFTPHDFELGETNGELTALAGGLSTEEAMNRKELIGPNFISVYVPNFFMAIIREFTSFFYIYQFTVLWLFYYFAYWQIGLVDTFVILLSAFLKVVIRLRSEHRIKKMAEFTDNVNILRDGQWGSYSTAELVPGDVFEVAEGKTAPCDAVILSGNIVADESSLTGEPLPIRKFPLRDEGQTYDRLGAGKISTLFAGTTMSQALRVDNEPVAALVTQTGTATDKGELVKKILFPNKVSFIFDEQIKIVILILLCCGAVCCGLAIWLYTHGTAAWFYAMFCICQLVSPLLPAALVVGQSVAAGRLRDKKIFCVDLPRILMAGKVQLFCFDKTGTLTREGLEFYGVQPIQDVDNIGNHRAESRDPAFGEHIIEVKDIPRLMQVGTASCHAVTTLNGQFIGNPVDIEMFRASKWQLEESNDPNYVDSLVPPSDAPGKEVYPVHVIKRFEFVHARMSMSVAVLDTMTNKVHIFVKGAYEKIKDLSTPASVPADYDTVTSGLAREGCYVLALAHREINLEEIGGLKAFKQWTRDQMEEEIQFCGLIVFKNQLKEDTTEAIAELKRGATRTVMITGDTALTGIYIARQCGMADPNAKVLLADLDKRTDSLFWVDVDESETFGNVNPDDYLRNRDHTAVELAVTGKAFHWMVDHDMIRKYLLDIRVFARMTPNGKVQCIQLHQERGITAMTGDGGNDCGALRAAHVGLAMSEAEASIVSPFSTSVRSVTSCVELIRQGRAALATSITGYKYLILYGQVMMMLKIFTFYFSLSMSQSVWIAVDACITVVLTWAVSQSKANPRLEGQRPTARILGPQIMASTIGLVIINWLFLIGAFAFLFQQPWYVCNMFDSSAVDVSKWWLLADNFEAEVLALICLFQFINNAAVQNFGYKFRQSWWRNYILVFLWAAYLAIVSYWVLADPNNFGCIMRFNCGSPTVLHSMGYYGVTSNIELYNTPLGHNVLPWDFRWKLWALSMGNVLAGLAYERLVILGPVHAWLARRFPVERLQVKL
ncbi:hypothetical protein NQZ79_g8580 [Umbelopsis isabellina]|nr:hypothetical protein NQZ79_g8580 [Umbelopsis isabellina]